MTDDCFDVKMTKFVYDLLESQSRPLEETKQLIRSANYADLRIARGQLRMFFEWERPGVSLSDRDQQLMNLIAHEIIERRGK